jgi:hypothetical protein
MQDRHRQFDEIFLQRTAGPYIGSKTEMPPPTTEVGSYLNNRHRVDIERNGTSTCRLGVDAQTAAADVNVRKARERRAAEANANIDNRFCRAMMSK